MYSAVGNILHFSACVGGRAESNRRNVITKRDFSTLEKIAVIVMSHNTACIVAALHSGLWKLLWLD